uniref:Putative secreted peptide n=1 Tax=Anopheles braziliensis TaxID=58242 RepID=A0A2M3ZR89_9DIPT
MRVFLMLLLHLTFTFKPPATSLRPTSNVCYQGATTQQTRQTLRPGFVIFLRGFEYMRFSGSSSENVCKLISQKVPLTEAKESRQKRRGKKMKNLLS